MAFFGEARLALRRLRKEPGFAVMTIVILTLAIGANTAIFSVIHAVLIHPSGVDAPERVAMLQTDYAKLGVKFPVVSVPDIADASSLKGKVETSALEQPIGYNLMQDGATQHLDGAQVSWRWFSIFGARPILGRTFVEEEDHLGANQSAVLSYGVWQSAFGGDRNVIGRTITLNQKNYRVVGVMRSDFSWPRGVNIWTPLGLSPDAYDLQNRFNENYYAAVRLRSGVTIEQLRAGLEQKTREEYFSEGQTGYGLKSGWSMAATPLTEFAAGPLRKPLYVLLGVVVLVLLIASANVAGLFLARASSRTREFGIRTALGATAGRLVQQLMTETVILGTAATVFGILLGPVFGKLLLWVIPHSLAEGYVVETSAGVLLFTAGVGLLTCLIAGMGPAIKMASSQKRLNLHEGGRSVTTSVEKQRLRSLFVVSEVAMAFVLLVGTGMFLTSLKQLQQVNPGFNPHGVLAGTVYYAGEAYRDNQEHQTAFVTAVLNGLSGKPGVTSAAATSSLPFSDPFGAGSFDIEGQPKTANDPGPHSEIGTATADYLKVMQIPLLAGRWIDDSDRAHTAPVVVIDSRLAQKYWPNQNPIGQHLRFSSSDPWSTVIGEVGDVRPDSLEQDSGEGMRYYPYSQFPNPYTRFLIRADKDPDQLAKALKLAVSSADPTQTAFNISLLESRVNDSLASRRLVVWLLSAFAGLALVLALVGIYSLIHYVTMQRKNEFGIRMALGAQRGQILSLVMRGALLWVGIGLALGLVLSNIATSTLRHFFTEFGPDAVSTSMMAMAIMIAVGAIAGLAPARQAASVDPASVLRSE